MRASPQLMFKLILRKYKYPPDMREAAVELVLHKAKFGRDLGRIVVSLGAGIVETTTDSGLAPRDDMQMLHADNHNGATVPTRGFRDE